MKHMCRAVASVCGNRGVAVSIVVAAGTAALVTKYVLQRDFYEEMAWIWWKTWYIRDMLVYLYVSRLTWYMYSWSVSAVTGLWDLVRHGPSENSMCCRLCRRRSKLERLEARASALGLGTVRWFDDNGDVGLWRRDPNIIRARVLTTCRIPEGSPLGRK